MTDAKNKTEEMFSLIPKDIAKGYTNMSVPELKLFLIATSVFHKKSTFNKDTKSVLLTKEELELVFGKKNTSEKYMSKYVSNIHTKTYTTHNGESIAPISTISIVSNLIELSFNDNVIVDTKRDKGKFSKIDIKDIINLKSVAQICFMFIKNSHNKNTVYINNDVFLSILGNGSVIHQSYVKQKMTPINTQLSKRLGFTVQYEFDKVRNITILTYNHSQKAAIQEPVFGAPPSGIDDERLFYFLG